MTLFFNLEILEAESKCNPSTMLDLLERHLNKRLMPKNSRDRLIFKNLVGHSFLLDAHSLIKDTADVAYKAQYIKLAGRRDYTLYKLYKVTYLDLSFFTDIDLDAIKTNPLLDIQQNKIHFKYEK